MIKYTLKCPDDHRFDSWFANAQAFETLQKAGHIVCAICGSGHVEKAIMAPQVRTSEKDTVARETLTAPATPAEQALQHLRKTLEANSDYVGDKFVSEARAMHLGDMPERPIFGEARIDEARALIEDGVPVMPLPFSSKRKAN